MKNGHSIVLRRSPSGSVSIPSECAVYPYVTQEPMSIMAGVIIVTAKRQLTVSTVLYNVHYIFYTKKRKLYTSLHTTHCTLHTRNCTLHTSHCTPDHTTLNIEQCKLLIKYSLLHTTDHALTAHYTLWTTQYALHTKHLTQCKWLRIKDTALFVQLLYSLQCNALHYITVHFTALHWVCT